MQLAIHSSGFLNSDVHNVDSVWKARHNKVDKMAKAVMDTSVCYQPVEPGLRRGTVEPPTRDGQDRGVTSLQQAVAASV